MTFQLKRDEFVRDGIKRIASRQIEKALSHLRAGGDPDETVHEIRIRFKRIRAALRLVRDELGDAAYRRENYLLRDAARPLTEVRDATVLVESLDNLTNAREFRQVRKLLNANRKAINRRVLAEQNAFVTVAERVEPVLARLEDWTIPHEGWAALGVGLHCVYQAGHRAMAMAHAEPSVENLHEWRKQAKYLWHALQLLEPVWIGNQKGLCDRAHDLTRLLGEDHDLAVLRQMLDADPIFYGGHGVLDGLLSLIKRRRENLEQQAFTLGATVYGEAPTDFMKRIAPAWIHESIKEKSPQEQTQDFETPVKTPKEKRR
jgi:CHAD domain-containing protein